MNKIIDLTMPIYEGMPQHPSHGRTPMFLTGTRTHDVWRSFSRKNYYNENDLVSFQNENIIVCGHTGTHMDSCFHGDPESPYTIDKMPIECGFGDAIWLDVSHRFGPKARITAKDLKEAEAKTGTSVRKGDIVLIFTGWSAIQDPASYALDHMGLSIDAGEWLREKQVKTVGIDTCNVDAPGELTLPVHMNFLRPRCLGLGNDAFIAIIENLVNINRIPKSRFLFSGAPIPYLGGTGGQVRALAIVD
ncbi:cyclase family protein [Brevibacillus nitrificans]|uniref:cyclase family protein n=1 Tax=Brevibacillus nitrificans TaxID=651560 RepID=UPI002855BD9C|nr:cyclase family protein [Brevibacillus nitrificans]MDR7313892.1 kynurenine formamidase [Brevibacillus nitrificans]